MNKGVLVSYHQKIRALIGMGAMALRVYSRAMTYEITIDRFLQSMCTLGI